MTNDSIKFINYEEIITNIMDIVMPDRDKSSQPEEIARQLKLINILAEKLLSKYIDICIHILKMPDNEGTNMLLYYSDKYHVEMEYTDDDHQPALQAKIMIYKNKEDDKEEELDVIRPSDYPDLFKFDLYPGYNVDDEPKTEIEQEIITRLKFIKENKLDECYDKICGIYFLELLKYASKRMHELDTDLKEFKKLIRIRPDYIITPVSILLDTSNDDQFLDMIKVYDRC